MMDQLKHKTIENIVTEALRMSIINGDFLPGQPIDEAEFAKSMLVSRMPVRNAISALEVEGLVKRIPRRGTFVTRLTEDEVEQAYSLRVLVENKAIVVARERCDSIDLEEIQKIVALPISSYKTSKDFLEKNREFHYLLIKPSKWNIYIRYSNQLRNSFLSYLSLADGYKICDIRNSINEHHEIFEAYFKKDYARLTILNEIHINNAKKRILEILRGKIKNGKKEDRSDGY